MPQLTLTFSQETVERIQLAFTKKQGRDPEEDPFTKDELKQKLIAYLRNEVRAIEEAEALVEAQAIVGEHIEPEIT